MTTRSKLMLMAAALAPLPLYAQQQDAAPTQVPAAVIAPATPVAPVLQSAALSPLSFIPADVEAALVIPDFGHRVDPKGRDRDSKAIGSVALAAAKGNAQSFANLYSLFAIVPSLDATDRLGDEWASAAKECLRSIIKDATKEIGERDLQRAIDLAKQAKLHPVYGVMRINEGGEAIIDKGLDEVIGEMKRLAERNKARFDEDDEDDEKLEFLTIGKFSCLKITAPDIEKDLQDRVLPVQVVKPVGAQQEDAEMDDDAESPEMEMREYKPEPEEIIAAKALSKRSIYLMVCREGQHVIGIACEDPSEIALAESPETSILNTPQWQAVAPHLQDDLICAFSLSPEMNNAAYAQTRGFVDWFASGASIFEKMAAADAESAETFKAAAAGIKTIVSEVEGLLPSVEQPLFCQVWNSGDTYYGELTCDAMGHTFETTTLNLAEKAASPDTIFCLESTPLNLGTRYALPGLKAVGQAGMDVFNGVVASLGQDLQTIVKAQSNEVLKFLPEASATCTAIGTMLEGVGGSTGIVVDGNGIAPQYVASGEKAPMFRIALRTGVKDREKLAKGWDELINAAGDVVEKIGQDRAMLSMLPIVPAKIAKETISYNVAIPGILTPDMGANVTVSDSAFVAGSSAKLNKELVSTTGTQEFAGATFVFNTEPLAKAARGLADAMLKAAGPIEVVHRSRKCACGGENSCNCEKMEACGDEDCWGYDEYEHPTADQMGAVSARNFAKRVERFAKHVRQIKGSITIKDSIETIRVEVKMNKK